MKRGFPIPVVVMACLALAASAGEAFGQDYETFIPEEARSNHGPPPGSGYLDAFGGLTPWLGGLGALFFVLAAVLLWRGGLAAARRAGLLSILLLSFSLLSGFFAYVDPLDGRPESLFFETLLLAPLALLGAILVHRRAGLELDARRLADRKARGSHPAPSG